MPLQIRISVNEKVIETYHIARLRSKTDGVNEYSVIKQDTVPDDKEWENGVFFTHQQSDGAGRCAEIGLEAHRKRSQGHA